MTTPALANDPRIKALAKDLTSPQVAEFIRKTYNGSGDPGGPSVMITIEGLSKTYAGTGRPALNDIALQIPKGAIYGILGRSGAGQKYAHPLS